VEAGGQGELVELRAVQAEPLRHRPRKCRDARGVPDGEGIARLDRTGQHGGSAHRAEPSTRRGRLLPADGPAILAAMPDPEVQAVPGTVLLDVFILAQLATTLLRDASERQGLTSGEFAISSAINAFGPMTPTELADRLGIPPTTISSRLAQLGRKGHVRRRPNPADGRSSLLETTDEGRVALEGVFPVLDAGHEAIARHLGRPLADVRADLAPLIVALRAAVDDSSPVP